MHFPKDQVTPFALALALAATGAFGCGELLAIDAYGPARDAALDSPSPVDAGSERPVVVPDGVAQVEAAPRPSGSLVWMPQRSTSDIADDGVIGGRMTGSQSYVCRALVNGRMLAGEAFWDLGQRTWTCAIADNGRTVNFTDYEVLTGRSPLWLPFASGQPLPPTAFDVADAPSDPRVVVCRSILEGMGNIVHAGWTSGGDCLAARLDGGTPIKESFVLMRNGF